MSIVCFPDDLRVVTRVDVHVQKLDPGAMMRCGWPGKALLDAGHSHRLPMPAVRVGNVIR